MSDPTIYYTGPIVTLEQARAEKIARYFTGKPCRRGHIDERFSNNSGCVFCHKISQNKYAEANREKCRRRVNEYKKNNPQKRKITVAESAKKNRHKKRKTDKAWVERNRELVNERARARRKSLYEKDKNKVLSWAHERRARAKESGGKFTKIDIENIYKMQRGKCANPSCKKKLKKYDVDHIVPLSKGGSNQPKNLQLLCPSCNRRKSKKHPLDWAREQGLLV